MEETEMKARIEQLERDLKAVAIAEPMTATGILQGREIGQLEQDLAAEKALADRLAAQLQGWWDCFDTFSWRDHEDREALAAYRKARGL